MLVRVIFPVKIGSGEISSCVNVGEFVVQFSLSLHMGWFSNIANTSKLWWLF